MKFEVEGGSDASHELPTPATHSRVHVIIMNKTTYLLVLSVSIGKMDKLQFERAWKCFCMESPIIKFDFT